MNAIAKVLYICVFVLTILACGKDQPIPVAPTVDYYMQRSTIFDTAKYYKGSVSDLSGQGQCIFGLDYIQSSQYNYDAPCINPNNKFQFCYIRAEKGVTRDGDYDLYKYDFSTGVSTLICKHVFYTPHWGAKDWIIFTGIDIQLYKIKSNGDSLTKLTNTGDFNNHAKWNARADKYLYFDASIGAAGSMIISDENGRKTATLNVYMSKWAWLNDTIIVYAADDGTTNMEIRKYSLNSNISTLITKYYSVGVSNVHIQDNTIYTTGSKAMYKITEGNTVVIDSCYQGFLGSYVQPIGDNRYLFRRSYGDYSQVVSRCKVYFSRAIHILDKNNNTEREVDLSK